ncbi:unnamed protein product [Caenorhabditis angaria]|uniref:Uncharacterized protein n=1 Tax=Caenorhabditis angaria TaxID=860376 RepID=A0A9P1IMI6_9PELO|nr:unnamed protein product [Caenorhabditis angaria]
MSILFLFFVFPIFLANSVDQLKTRIRFEYNINCNIQKYWGYSIEFLEEDTGSQYDDKIVAEKWRNFEGVIKEKRVSFGKITGGDGYGNNFYEIVAKIHHTCTDDGNIYEVRERIGEFEVERKEFNITFELHIDNLGTKKDTFGRMINCDIFRHANCD